MDQSSNSTINSTVVYNQLLDRIEQMKFNRYIDDTSLFILLFAYTLLIVLSAFGNIVVLITLVKKPEMRTERNLYIANLAVSDLVLCLFTMPFSLLEIVLKYWFLGFIPCKLMAGLEATSIYVSTFSIMAIALDRYRVIIHTSQPKTCKPIRSLFILLSIWFMAVVLSTPLYWYRTLVTENISEQFQSKFPNITRTIEPSKLKSLTVDVCLEEWPIKNGRALYTIFAFIVQYFVPILVVSIAYLQIYLKLKKRLRVKSAHTQSAERKAKHKARTHRTNLFLISIALIFGISWLPLNILNILIDHSSLFEKPAHFRIAFAICHMIGMSSAVSNSWLYGALNENFKKEFRLLFSQCTSSSFVDCICRLKGTSSSSSTPSAVQRSAPGSIRQKPEKKHHDIIRDTSSSKDFETLNSTSNPVFNYYSTDHSSRNFGLNSSSIQNSRNSILNVRPSMHLYAKRPSIEPTTNSEQLIEQSRASITDRIENRTTSFDSSNKQLNNSTDLNNLGSVVNAHTVPSMINGTNNSNCLDSYPAMATSRFTLNPISTAIISTNGTSHSNINNNINEKGANLHQFIRQTHFKSNDLNDTGDHTLYLNFEQDFEQNFEQNFDKTDEVKCKDYLPVI